MERVQVFKFGGASVRDAEGVRNVGRIVQMHAGKPLVVVVSAMDKTTNELELLAKLAEAGNESDALGQFNRIRRFHHTVLDALLHNGDTLAMEHLNLVLDDLQRTVQGVLLLRDFPNRIFDRMMAYGELMSSILLAAHLKSLNLPAVWMDARELILTDSTWRSAEVIWPQTITQIQAEIGPILNDGQIAVVQGFIGRSADGHTTTLGREGSDYTASILASALEAERVTIWKDVPGVMSGDPKRYPKALKIDQLSYEQAVEMTFFGASVIHPKTIKPLQNLGIPLHVNSFQAPANAGTVIHSTQLNQPRLPVVILHKTQQALITLRPLDLSFMDESLLRRVLMEVQSVGLQLSLVQTSAISLTLCVNDRAEHIQEFIGVVSSQFHAEAEQEMELLSMLYAEAEQVELPPTARLVQRQNGHYHFVLPRHK
jgi:aspartate kinase